MTTSLNGYEVELLEALKRKGFEVDFFQKVPKFFLKNHSPNCVYPSVPIQNNYVQALMLKFSIFLQFKKKEKKNKVRSIRF